MLTPRTIGCVACGIVLILLCFRNRFLDDHLFKKDDPLQSSTIQRIWHPALRDWDLILQELQRDRRVKWKENRWRRQSLYHTSKVEVECWINWWNLFSQWYDWWSEIPISELHLGKFPDSMEFQSWKVNFKTEVLSKTAYPHLTMHWNKVDDLMTSRSVAGRTGFPDFDMQDAMIAFALNRLRGKHIHFSRRASVEEQRVQKNDGFLRGRQNCLHEKRAFPCNRSPWSGTRTLRHVHFNLTEWRCPRFRRQMGSSIIISEWNAFRCDLGRIVQVKITGFCSASDCIGLVRPRNSAKQWTAEFFTIEDSYKTSYRSDNENSKLHGPERCCGKGISHQESKRKQSLRWEESGRVFSVEGTRTMFQRRLM